MFCEIDRVRLPTKDPRRALCALRESSASLVQMLAASARQSRYRERRIICSCVRGLSRGILQDSLGQAACCLVCQASTKTRQGYVLQTVCSQPFCQQTEMTKCHVCEIGRVAENKGSASCTLCAASSASLVRLAASARQVSAERTTHHLLLRARLVRGYFSFIGSGSVFALCARQVQDQTEGTSCKPCAVNHFANETEMTKCHVCEIGRVAENKGSASCTLCAAGKFGEPGPACSKCSAGRYRESDTSSALACELVQRDASRTHGSGGVFALCARQVPRPD